jgi:hypothetical protein
MSAWWLPFIESKHVATIKDNWVNFVNGFLFYLSNRFKKNGMFMNRNSLLSVKKTRVITII